MVFAISSPVSALRKLPYHPRKLGLIWDFFGLIRVMILQKPCYTILMLLYTVENLDPGSISKLKSVSYRMIGV